MALDYGTRNILLKYIPFYRREDLREVPGMKQLNDRISFVFQKIIIKKTGEDVHIEMHGDEDDHIRFWQFTPARPGFHGMLYTKWESSSGRFLQEKAAPITGPIDENVKNLLEHLLDRDGTVIDVLDLSWLPDGLQFKHRIRVHSLNLSRDVEFSSIARFLHPIHKVDLQSSKRHGEHEVISNAAKISVYPPSSEDINLLNPSISLTVSDQLQKTPVYEMAALVKNLIRRSRPSGFQVNVQYPKCKVLLKEFVSDRELGCKPKRFKYIDGYSFERDGQEIFFHCVSSSLNIKFINIGRNVAISAASSNRTLPSSSVPQRMAPLVPLLLRSLPVVPSNITLPSFFIPPRILSSAPVPSCPIPVVPNSRTIPSSSAPQRTGSSEVSKPLCPNPIVKTKIDRMSVKCENGQMQINVTGGGARSPFFSSFTKRTVINHLVIEGPCQNLFNNSTVLADNVTLKSKDAYPAEFFEMFTNERFAVLTATCTETLKNGEKLRRNAGKIIYLNDIEMAKDEEDDDIAEPPQKKMKKSS